MSSESDVKVVRIGPCTPHPNADTLTNTVVGGVPTTFKTGDYKEGDLAVFIPVDMLVDTGRPEFAWLKPGTSSKGTSVQYRTRACKLRGLYSEGFFIKAQPGMVEGQDVADDFGVTKYLPPAEREPHPDSSQQHAGARKPKGYELRRTRNMAIYLAACLGAGFGLVFNPWWALLAVAAVYGIYSLHTHVRWVPTVAHYDIEPLRKHADVFKPNEKVIVTEKTHGAHAGYLKLKGKLYCFSRTVQRAHDGSNVWSKIATEYKLDQVVPEGCVLRGEIYGAEIQDLDYNCKTHAFVAFDLQNFKTREYFPDEVFAKACNQIPTVPVVYIGPYDREHIEKMAEMRTTLGYGKHVSEGVVVKPFTERTEPGLGRCILKVVGQSYKLRKENK